MAIADKLLAPARLWSGAFARGWARRAAREPFTVALCYHRVVAAPEPGLFGVERGVSADVFERQMRFMRRHFRPVAADAAGSGAGASFAVTFDDGMRDNHDVAAPILDRLGIPATFFVVQDYVGTNRRFWWEELAALLRASRRAVLATDGLAVGLATLPATLPLGDLPSRERAHAALSAGLMRLAHAAIPAALDRIAHALAVARAPEGRDFALMDWAEVRALAGRGHAIGGHTATHCNLGQASAAELDAEVTQATLRTQAAIGQPVRSFAFPYGGAEHIGAGVAERLARHTQVRAAFSTGGGVVARADARYDLPRIQLNRSRAYAWAYNVESAVRGRARHHSPKIASA